MPFRYAIILGIFLALLTTPAFAKLPRKGFMKGPYITLTGGVMQFDWDKNSRTGVEEGAPWEPMMGLGFGWNLNDWLAPELLIRYTTDDNQGRREYIAGANFGFVFSWLAKPLLDFEKWRVLPFIKPGFGLQVAVLPGDPSSADNKVTSIGFGPSVGGGIRFLYNKYLYFGLEAQEEILKQQNVIQTLNTGATLQIYKGGWVSQFETFATIGLHF